MNVLEKIIQTLVLECRDTSLPFAEKGKNRVVCREQRGCLFRFCTVDAVHSYFGRI